MRSDRIIQTWQDTMWKQIDLPLLFRRELQLRFVNRLIQRGLTAQSSLRLRCANEIENCFVIDQRLSSPITTDLRKETMLDRIPLGSSCRIMRDDDRQAKFIRQLLQPIFPPPGAIAVGIATITFNQQFIRVGVSRLSNLQPPASDGCHRKLRCLMRSANDDKPVVVCHIVNPEGNCYPVSIARPIIRQHSPSLLPPRAASVFEVPDQLAFLRIDADHGLASFEGATTHPSNVSHLPITLWVLLFGQTLAIDADRITQFPQQPADRDETDFEAFASQCPRQRAQGLARPLDTCNRIARRDILQQFLQSFQDPWLFFSIGDRPAPARRTRPAVARSARWISARPRQIVLRLIPVISISLSIPPCPH